MKVKLRFWSEKDAIMLDWMCIMQSAFNQLSVADQHAATDPFSPLLYRIFSGLDGVIMHWTGLIDKNGKDIYEGDIVKAASQGQHAEVLVKWSIPTARFFLWRGHGGALIWNLSGGGEDLRVETCEVIGNAYENPELLAAVMNFQ